MDNPTDFIEIVNDLQSLREFSDYNENHQSDVTIRCGEEDFLAHRKVLKSHSAYFQRILSGTSKGHKLVVLNHVDERLFRLVLKYMYEGSISIHIKDRIKFSELLSHLNIAIPIAIDDVQLIESNCKNFITDTFYGCDRFEEKQFFISNIQTAQLFISTMKSVLETVTMRNVEEKSTELLSLDVITHEWFDIIIKMVLQRVCQMSTKHVDLKALAKLMSMIIDPEDTTSTAFFKKLSSSSAEVFRQTFNGIPTEPLEYNIDLNVPSLDEQVQVINYAANQFCSDRCNRIAHFICHLYLLNLIDLNDFYFIFELSVTNPNPKPLISSMAIAFHHIYEVITKNNGKSIKFASLSDDDYDTMRFIVLMKKSIWMSGCTNGNDICCDIPLSERAQELLQSGCYSKMRSIEEDFFWSRFLVSVRLLY